MVKECWVLLKLTKRLHRRRHDDMCPSVSTSSVLHARQCVRWLAVQCRLDQVQLHVRRLTGSLAGWLDVQSRLGRICRARCTLTLTQRAVCTLSLTRHVCHCVGVPAGTLHFAHVELMDDMSYVCVAYNGILRSSVQGNDQGIIPRTAVGELTGGSAESR